MKTPSLFVVAAILVFSRPGHCENSAPSPNVLYNTSSVPMLEQVGEFTYPDAPRKPRLSPKDQEKIEAQRHAREQAALLKHRREQTEIANGLLRLFATTPSLELISLDPDPRLREANSNYVYTSNDTFAGGCRITGRAQTKSPAEIGELIASLRAGFSESDGESPDCSFAPRHSLRFTAKGKTYLAVICFECQQGFLCEIGNPANRANLLLTRTPEKIFDATFTKHGLTKAP